MVSPEHRAPTLTSAAAPYFSRLSGYKHPGRLSLISTDIRPFSPTIAHPDQSATLQIDLVCSIMKKKQRSGIVNNPNDADNSRYLVNLIGSVITVSLETVKIIERLPDVISNEPR